MYKPLLRLKGAIVDDLRTEANLPPQNNFYTLELVVRATYDAGLCLENRDKGEDAVKERQRVSHQPTLVLHL